MNKSEIRQSEIEDLLTKVRKNDYGKYLKEIRLNKVRRISEETITFDFPVTALVAQNGGGKTTILGAAALAYKDIKPSLFFTKSGKLDNSMANWNIEYILTDKSVNAKDSIKKTAAFKDLRWRRDKFLERSVLNFGVSRTVPAMERTELKKCATKVFEVSDSAIKNFEEAVCNNVEKVLGKNIAGYKQIDVDSNGRIKLLTGVKEDQEFSEFHFGAGESSIIRLIMEIEAASENSLVLIEEIENGLHPIATTKLVEYLIEVAKRKKIQSIFTTHSDYALLFLPNEAIWSVHDGKLQQGKLKIATLREIQYVEHTSLIVYVEDDFTRKWIEAIFRQLKIDLKCIEIHALGGDGNAVKANNANNDNPAKKAPSVCFIDGDSAQEADAAKHIFRFPGFYPEEYPYDQILKQFDTLGLKLCVALGWDNDSQKELKEKMEKVKRETRDYHLIYSKLGMELNLLGEDAVKNAFLNIWCQHHLEECRELIEPINDLLPYLD